MKKSDLGVRTSSAIVMVSVCGLLLYFGRPWWTIFVAALALLVYYEWVKLVIAFTHSMISRVLWLAFGIVYVGTAAVGLNELRGDADAGGFDVLQVIGAVIAVDVGAYFAGRNIGGPKIAPKLSPSKTWSGLIGGGVAASLFLGFFITNQYRWNPWACDFAPTCAVSWDNAKASMIIGFLVAVIAQAGDFFESWMKRKAGVKDSGRLLPGHGGVFDRVDGLIAVLFVGCLVAMTIAFGAGIGT